MGNGSTAGKPTGSSWVADMRMLSLVFYCVVLVLGILGNGLVIYVTGFKMKRTVNSVWFLNLALADFLFTTFLIFPIIGISQDYQWNVGRVMCKLNTFVVVVNLFASVFILLAISVDRCLATRVVVWAQNKRTVPKAKVICLVIWIIAMACSAPYATFRDIKEYKNNITRCDYSAQMTKKINVTLALFRFTVGFLIPFVGISVSYVAIYCRAKSLQTTRKGRSRRIIIAVILAFFLCWLPFHIFELLKLFSKDHRMAVQAGGPVAVGLAFLNSCLNPILYVFMCDDFRKKLKRSICHVLESALAEDHMSFMSSRSLSAHFSKITRRSESAAPGGDNKETSSSLCPEDKGVLHFEAADTNDYPNKD